MEKEGVGSTPGPEICFHPSDAGHVECWLDSPLRTGKHVRGLLKHEPLQTSSASEVLHSESMRNTRWRRPNQILARKVRRCTPFSPPPAERHFDPSFDRACPYRGCAVQSVISSGPRRDGPPAVELGFRAKRVRGATYSVLHFPQEVLCMDQFKYLNNMCDEFNQTQGNEIMRRA